MRRLVFTIATLIQLFYLTTSHADTTNGEALEQKHCSGCHANMFNGDSSTIYLRGNRRVTDHGKLISQVNFCKNNLGLTWFDDQVMDVVEHLDQRYYHFNSAK